MSATTTLMTFLVRVPPATRSVVLLGSWDNFTKPYVMRRDSRIGAEHWSGCHNFQNIICDGIGKSGNVSRDGGLKMGGTYWYYYKLDDEIEFHNSAEPSTTACPLLPGQLVNVLQVPFSLASGRPRNASTSSAVSEFRTMNPDDKFLNPRPVPKPQLLPRLKTSPTLPSFPFSTTSDPTSSSMWSVRRQPSSQENSPPISASAKLFRLPRKNRSTSPARDRMAGIKATIMSFRSPRSASPDGDTIRGRPVELDRGVDISHPVLVHRSAEMESARPETRDGILPLSRSRSTRHPEMAERPSPPANLALRRGVGQPSEIEQPIISSSFQQNRRQRSQSRDPSPLRRSMSFSEDRQLREMISELSINRNVALETVKEVHSNLNTPEWPVTAIKIPKEEEATRFNKLEITLSQSESDAKNTMLETLCLEKRLPTLPNTPSSAYPPSAADNSPSKRLSAQIAKMQQDALFQSHFSNSTASNGSATDSFQAMERSHFSAWTNSTLTSSPTSQYFSRLPSQLSAETLPIEIPKLPEFPPRWQSLDPRIQEQNLARSSTRSDTLPSTTSFSTIASSASTSPLSERFEELDLTTLANSASSEQHETYPRHIQTYRLPLDETHHITIPQKPMFQDFVNSVNNANNAKRRDGDVVHQTEPAHSSHPHISHSESMQELIDELSYLSTLIES